MSKEKLDELLEAHKAQPAGNGYIDIIVKREHYKPFILDLIKNGFKVKSISWWEWCASENENLFGLGGPTSRHFDGWFSELPVPIDDIELSLMETDYIQTIMDLIETKSISYPNQKITFKESTWLIPAIWLDVPDNWRNKYCA